MDQEQAKQETNVTQTAIRACYVLHHSSLLGLFFYPEATCSPETSIDFQRTTLRYIQEVRTMNILLKSQVDTE
jgi:hypothetical protein